ncbi:MAG: methylated-DNA--[protein]-cysteine S-methyltransferase [Gammaproteobacteria bacterium]|nr:methylated-DNA--[protein]-cysteine S-methyltransferase [Gammaproteobacteria bacterium]
MHVMVFLTSLGPLRLEEEGGFLTACLWSGEDGDATAPTSTLERAAGQLSEYLAGRRSVFDIPLRPRGTPFQEAVWQALTTIPYGATWSYRELAAAVGRPGAARAVGTANARNPLSIFIPCHRVIRATGEVGGYGGGVSAKERLLALEAQHAPRP